MALTRQAIVRAGLEILDTYGLGDLSMRRVADALGVQAGALYYHVPNKQSLLAAMADHILGKLVPGPKDQDAPRFLEEWAHSLREALVAHRDGGELVASAHALGMGVADPAGWGLAPLSAAGVPEPDATMAALLHLVLGHVVEEQTRAQMHALGVIADFDPVEAERTFAWGVRIFVAGVRAMGQTDEGPEVRR